MASPTAWPPDHLRDRDNMQGLAITPQKLAMMPQGLSICDPMLNSVLNGDWSNSVPGRQFPKGEVQ